MDQVKQTVESAGLSMDDVVSMQIFCTDLKLYDTFNAVYSTYFHGNYPARAFSGSCEFVAWGEIRSDGNRGKEGAIEQMLARACSVGVHFHRGRVQTESFNLDAQNLLLLSVNTPQLAIT